MSDTNDTEEPIELRRSNIGPIEVNPGGRELEITLGYDSSMSDKFRRAREFGDDLSIGDQRETEQRSGVLERVVNWIRVRFRDRGGSVR